jgi:hypothetical protein
MYCDKRNIKTRQVTDIETVDELKRFVSVSEANTGHSTLSGEIPLHKK